MRRKRDMAPRPLTVTTRIEDELVRREAKELSLDFRKFVESAWEIIEPGVEFLDGQPIDVICQHLEACADGRISKLLVNIPPRHSKSSLISVLFPAWLWTRDPGAKVLSASYAEKLAIRDSAQSRRLIESDWYRERWPHITLSDDENLKTSYLNTAMGRRQICSVGGAVTGLGGDFLILDDPHNVQEGESAAVRETAVTWFRESFYNRTNSRKVCRIVIMQRVHHKDVSAYIIDGGGWEHLNLPMEYEGVKNPPTSLGWQDPREIHGSILWPERFAADEVADLKKMGSYAWSGQYQQRPAPRGGGMFKRAWLKFWYDPEQGIPDPVMYQTADGEWVASEQRRGETSSLEAIQSWDLAFKDGPENDYVVGQVWVRKGPDCSLLAQERGQWDFPATKAAIRRLHDAHPVLTTLVEEKANGAAIISDLKGEIAGLVAVLPMGGKESRAASASASFEGGNVWLPHPEQYPWVLAYVEELCQFPKGAHDDQVDATSQALTRLREKRTELIDLGLSDSSPYREDMLITVSHWQN